MISSLALAACSPHARPGPVDAAITPAPAMVAADARAQATASLRCEECHARIARDWTGSAHAGALRDPIYVAMLAGADDKGCLPCHAPVQRAVDPADPVAREAIGCDGCHLVSAVDETPAGATIHWGEHATTKYGPLCEAEDHYFHKMGCSPLHGASRFCAPCHEWTRTTSAGPLAIISDYTDWKTSDKGEAGLECQACHMPSLNDEIARGGKRVSLHDHAFGRGRLAGKAIELDATIDHDAVQVVVKNSGAGHAIPAGMPEHRLVVRVRALDAAGKELAKHDEAFGRTLADATGTVVPAVRAVRLVADTRLKPGEARSLSVPLPKGTAKLEVSAAVRRVATELVPLLGHGEEETVLMTRSIVVGKKKP